eukprot:2693917-Prymnesium_polylepis.1
MLPDTKASATYRGGSTGCCLLVLPGRVFVSLFGSNPNFEAEMRLKLLQRACTFEDVIAHGEVKTAAPQAPLPTTPHHYHHHCHYPSHYHYHSHYHSHSHSHSHSHGEVGDALVQTPRDPPRDRA